MDANQAAVEELRWAHRIIAVMLTALTPTQKVIIAAQLGDEGVSPEGMTRYHERRAVLIAAGAL